MQKIGTVAQIFCCSFQDELTKIRDTLSKTSNDWKVRVDTLSSVRALMLAGAVNYDEFMLSLKTLELPFIASVKDLRSQVRYLFIQYLGGRYMWPIFYNYYIIECTLS